MTADPWMTGVEVRTLDAAGLDAGLDDLADILHACVQGGAAVGFLLPFSVDDARAYWRAKVAPGVAAGTRILVVAAIDGTIVGTVQVDTDMPPNQPHRADVTKLLVHPRARRRGVARAVMAEAETQARRRGRALLTLDTRAGDAAEPLYVSLGYAVAGRIPGYARNAADPGFHATTVMYKAI
jgi:ribosomal protein S18 acetylase RimI-like enzyme